MNEPFLSPDEVEALIERADDGTTAAADAIGAADVIGAGVPAAPRGEVRPYDLTQQERIVRGRMPTLELVHERFARNLRTGLFNFMRRSPDITVGPVKVEKYSAFLRDITVPSNINIVQVRPLRGSGLLICEPQLVFGIIDSMFGGDGSLPSEFDGRDFSATEQRIIQRTIEVICTEYRKAWVGVYPLELEYLRSERQPQYASIATPSEIVVSVRFDITIGKARGALHLCLPYATLEPIRETLYSSLQGDSSTIDRRWVDKLSRQLETAEIELVADLARARATVADLVALEIGDFIELELERTLTAKVDGVPLLECRYGVSNGRYALKLERFATNTQDKPNGAPDGAG